MILTTILTIIKAASLILLITIFCFYLYATVYKNKQFNEKGIKLILITMGVSAILLISSNSVINKIFISNLDENSEYITYDEVSINKKEYEEATKTKVDPKLDYVNQYYKITYKMDRSLLSKITETEFKEKFPDKYIIKID